MAVDKYIEDLLAPIALPVAYRAFKPKKDKPVPDPPYLIYLIPDEDGRGADGKNLVSKKYVTVELYVTAKNVELEAKVEEALSAYEYSKHEEYIEAEAMWQISYDFEIYKKIRRNT